MISNVNDTISTVAQATVTGTTGVTMASPDPTTQYTALIGQFIALVILVIQTIKRKKEV